MIDMKELQQVIKMLDAVTTGLLVWSNDNEKRRLATWLKSELLALVDLAGRARLPENRPYVEDLVKEFQERKKRAEEVYNQLTQTTG